MTDRELLELAAKAAGYGVLSGPAGAAVFGGNTYYFDVAVGARRLRWNPLTDDGDALSLAVAVLMDIVQLPTGCKASPVGWREIVIIETVSKNRAAATRRAIVRAAASIAQSMNQETPGKEQ